MAEERVDEGRREKSGRGRAASPDGPAEDPGSGAEADAVGDQVAIGEHPAAVSGEEAPAETGKYVYCIIPCEDDREFGPIGIGEDAGRVYTLRYRDLAAVISDTPLRIYDPTRENVLAHELVNKTVMEEYTVIPMSFGTMFRTEEDIIALLESTYQALEDVLDKMRNKIEFGLKVLWDRDRVVSRLEEEDEEIRRLKDEITGRARSSTYFARVQLGRMIESALESTAATYLNDIHHSLAPVAAASRTNKPIGDRMIMNAAYLVDRAEEEEFDRVVKELGRRYEELLTFTYTGPWPPYNFVNIKLRLERADA